jgi:Uma2 family endonuclease
MSNIALRHDDTTFEEFLDLIEDGQKADLIDGVIYMASPDNTDAADLQAWLSHILGLFVEVHDLGKIYLSRVAYKIGPKRGPEPDIGFVPKAMEHRRRRGFIDGPPALAIEIVSPDSVDRDYVQKRAIYEAAGVAEYWIIDPDDERATFLRLLNGRFTEVSLEDHLFHSEVLPGFWLDARWFGAFRPRAYDVLRQLRVL